MQSENLPDGRTFLEEARRRQIVEHTIESLAEDGYAGTTLASIARRAGMSKSVIVYHFGGKDEVLLAVAEEVFARATEELRPHLDSARSVGERLHAYLRGRVAFLATHRNHMLALFEIWVNLRDAAGKMRFGEADAADTVDAIEQLLRAGQRTGEFADFDPAVMAMVIRQAVDGVLHQLRVRPDLDLDHHAQELIDLFDRATGATTPPTKEPS